MRKPRVRMDRLRLAGLARLARRPRLNRGIAAPRALLAIAAFVALGSGVPRLDLAPADVPPTARLALAPAPESQAAVAPSAARTVETSIASTALGRDMRVAVFLPPGYDTEPERRYPVLYMLHGLGGDHTQWIHAGLLEMASQLMATRALEPFIIVLPDGDSGYWVDHAEGGPRYGRYVSRDLVDSVDREYRTLAARDARALGGMSMGGHGALQLGLNNPDRFRVIGAHSVALRTKEQAFAFFGDRAYFEAHDPVSMVRAHPEVARRLVIAIDIGDDDPWARAAQSFHGQLQAAGLVHLWTLQDGAHDEAYWRTHLEGYLRYYDQAFRDRRGSTGE